MSEEPVDRTRGGVSAIVVTLGMSPWLQACLESLRRANAELSPSQGPLEILLVDQAKKPCALPEGLADQILRPGKNLGFARANNLALAKTRGDFIILINDDAILEEGWLSTLLEAMQGRKGVAAVQGVNIRMDRPELLDGRGLAWNKRWQAVQIDHGQPSPAQEVPSSSVFGVSATAALFRRRALEQVVGPDLQVFDPTLGSYYEDVDLACRLRRQGQEALAVPAARARHAGSTTGDAIGAGSTPWIYGNRLLVLARWLGRGFWPRLPLFLLRDSLDLVQALARRDLKRALGIPKGWAHAASRMPSFAHMGRPADNA